LAASSSMMLIGALIKLDTKTCIHYFTKRRAKEDGRNGEFNTLEKCKPVGFEVSQDISSSGQTAD